MNNLNTLQEAFQASILHADDCVDDSILGTERVSATTRLSIYSEAYRLRLIDALADNYPALHGLLGDEAFDRLARAYITGHPSQQPSIRWFGDRVAEFLRATPPYRDRPELSDLARFEWTLREVFDAQDSDVLAIEDISALPAESWPGMRIRLHPSVRRIDLHWNAPAMWTAADRGEPPVQPVESARPVAWVLWRKELNQYFRSADPIEAWALDAVRDGRPFAALCEGLCRWLDTTDAPLRAAGLLKAWVNEQMIAAVEFAAASPEDSELPRYSPRKQTADPC